MTDSDAIDYFVRTVVGDARSLSISEARPYLRGLLLIGEDRSELAPIRHLYNQLCQVDDQLELIASGQLKLPLNDPPQPLPPPIQSDGDGSDGDGGLPPHGPHGEIDPS